MARWVQKQIPDESGEIQGHIKPNALTSAGLATPVKTSTQTIIEITVLPRFEILREKKLVGNRLIMSLAINKTAELWSGFMPRRKEIKNTLTSELISLNVYPSFHFTKFKPTNEFEKWAAVEVINFDHIPENMETFSLVGGLYAVFDYKGSSSNGAIFQSIFETWLPNSPYVLDDRPHFEILGEKYKNNDPTSEEEIWIPVKLMTN